MAGEFLREAAVLGLVFIPLELWKNSQVSWEHVTLLGVAVTVSFTFGMIFEWTSCGVKRGREAWDEREV
jgi:hypothetical protein